MTRTNYYTEESQLQFLVIQDQDHLFSFLEKKAKMITSDPDEQDTIVNTIVDDLELQDEESEFPVFLTYFLDLENCQFEYKKLSKKQLQEFINQL